MVKVIEVGRQLKKVYGDKHKQIQLITHILVADYANLLILAYLIAAFPSDLIRLILHTSSKSDTSTLKSITNSPSVGEILY